MARPLRAWAPGIVHHLIARGNYRMRIYCDDRDRRAFLELLGDILGRYAVTCHAYCLMDKHYHLALMADRPQCAYRRMWRCKT